MNWLLFAFVFLGGGFLSFAITPLVRRAAFIFGAVDQPGDPRKIHKKPTPLLGGWAIFLGLFGIVLILTQLNSDILKALPLKYLIGVITAGLLIMVGGTLDDKFNLPAKFQWFFPFLAGLAIIASGIGIDFITNPLGGVVRLDQWNISVFSVNGIAYQVTVFADLFTILWLLGMAYTTKFLDGLDGLVSGIGVVASFVVFGISFLPEVNQSHTAILALALSGACLGFLIWNWHPAKIFLGEGGSLLIGFMLGVLSIISGGKIATALLVMGIPILDVLWVIGRRLFMEKRSIFEADRKHLHFRFLDAGFTVPQSVGIFLSLSALFGGLAIILRGKDKLLLLLGTVLAMILLVGFVVRKYQKENKKTLA